LVAGSYGTPDASVPLTAVIVTLVDASRTVDLAVTAPVAASYVPALSAARARHGVEDESTTPVATTCNQKLEVLPDGAELLTVY